MFDRERFICRTLANRDRCIGFALDVCDRMVNNGLMHERYFLSVATELQNRFRPILEQAREDNRHYSYDFNALSFFAINEPMHSFLIAKLLDPHAEHGQRDLFLKVFLERLGIEKPDMGHWVVTAEKGRIDVLLKRNEPHSVVIIENKSNYAWDQENQLYRYWHQEIYTPILQKEGRWSEEDHSSPTRYKILYLTPANWKQPSDNSLQRPVRFKHPLPETVPIRPTIWEFKKDIIDWLEDSLRILPECNHRMREYVRQYIELWCEGGR